MAALEVQLARLETQEAATRAALAVRREEMARLLGVLQGLSRLPPEAWMVRPGGPADQLRSAELLRLVLPEIRRRADTLKAQLDEAARLRDRLEAGRRELEGLKDGIAAEESRLRELLQQRGAELSAAETRFTVARARAAQLAREAGTLEELLTRIESQRDEIASVDAAADRALAVGRGRRAEEDGGEESLVYASTIDEPPPPRARGALGLPALGETARKFGEPDALGSASRGMTLRTREGAPVVSPGDGQVRFAGPFRGYGNLVIIDHGGGMHSLLSGLDALYVSAGQDVLGGEPVGRMQGSPPPDGEGSGIGIDRAGPSLYFELRVNGEPVDPMNRIPATSTREQG
jgi:septal ring factor EnvC (AmiA/AmiB activator)